METIDLRREDLFSLPQRKLKPYTGNRLRSLIMDFVVMGLAVLVTLWTAVYIYGPIVKGLGMLFNSAGEIPVFSFTLAVLGNLYIIACFSFLIWVAWATSHGAMQRFGNEESIQGIYWKFCEYYRHLMRNELETYARGRVLRRSKMEDLINLNKGRILNEAASYAVAWAEHQTLQAIKEHRDEANLFCRVKNSPKWVIFCIVVVNGLAITPLYIKFGMTFFALLPQESLVVLFGAIGMLVISYVDYLLSAKEWVENLLGDHAPETSHANKIVCALLVLIALFMVAGGYRADPEKSYSSMSEVREAYRLQLIHLCDASLKTGDTPLCRTMRHGGASLFDGADRLFSIEEDTYVDSRTLSPYRQECVAPAKEWMIQEWPFLPQTCYRLISGAQEANYAMLP